MTTTVIKKVSSRGRNFVIVRHDGHYCAVEDKYLDENNRLTKSLNGLQMYASVNFEVCVNSLLNAVEIEYLEGTGLSKAEAFSKVTGIDLETCKKIF